MRRRKRRIGLTGVCLLLVGLVAVPAGEARDRKVPPFFISVNADDTFYVSSEKSQRAQARLMARSGVESVRTPFTWFFAQPYATAADVPAAQRARFVPGPGDVPTDFTRTDQAVRITAQAGIRMVPIVMRTPRWASSAPPTERYFYSYMPANPQTYVNYLRALFDRYGPRGSFWRENRDLPKLSIRTWQIYNEVTRLGDRENQPAENYYPPLLRAAYKAIKSWDRGATVVLTGLHNQSWLALAKLYEKGIKGHFDVLGLHPYTRSVDRVLEIVRLNRRVLKRNGEPRKPVWLSEMVFSAAKGKISPSKYFGIETTPRGQGRLLTELYRGVIRARRKLHISRTFWARWSSPYEGDSTFLYAGLVQHRGDTFRRTPFALSAFTRVARRYEGCRKTSDARRCVKRKR